jgi:hypothetical protein
MIKRNLISIFFLFYFTTVFGQNKSLINNATIQYSELRTGFKLIDSNKVELAQYFIEVELSDSLRNEIKKLAYKDWIALLCDVNTDWAANLCLYDLYKRDAVVARLFLKKRSEWIKCCKAKEIEYWKSHLPR